MSDPTPPDVTVRPSPQNGERLLPTPAPWGFFKGVLTGAAIEIPVLASAVWILARLGYGDAQAGFMQILRLTTVFAGVAALFTAGGIGRLAAYASADGGRRRAVIVAARAHAVASAGLVIIAAIPLGHLIATPAGLIPIPLTGLIAGAICGALIGLVCGGTAPVGFADVWSIARKPTAALGHLLSPADLVKLGSALGRRTSHLFEGIFEPAAKPPEAAESTAPPPPSTKPADPATPKAE